MDFDHQEPDKKELDLETAEEILSNDEIFMEDENIDEQNIKNVFGWVALALGMIAFFIAPYLFAIASIILGFFARAQGAHLLGNSAIIIAILAVVSRLFIMPLI